MKRKLLACITAFFMMTTMLAGCGRQDDNAGQTPEENQPQTSSMPSSPSLEAKPIVRLGALQGPTGLGMVALMEQNEQKETGNLYEITMAGAPDEITGKIISGELDIAAVPTNVASVLYNRTEGEVKIIAVGTLGVLYLLQRTDGDAIASIADLEGETIHTTGQGATQEYVLDFLLRQNGLTPGEDVEVEYKSEHAELATLIAEGTVDIALLPQPFVTTVQQKDESVKQALDITEEWEKATGGAQLTMGCVVVRSDFLEKDSAAVDTFLKEYRESIEFANSNVDQTAEWSGKFEVVNEEVAKAAIPYCNISYLDGEAMRESVGRYLEIIHQSAPESVGGNLPDDAFYYVP